MKFSSLTVVSAAFVLLQFVSAQEVSLFVGELDGDVYVEWSGSLTYLYREVLEPDESDLLPGVQFRADVSLWVAFASAEYSYLTGSNDFVTYNYNQPGIFNVVPDQFMGMYA